ncbi:Patched domain-containing protein 3 [Mactra antiquata]
MSVNKPLMNGGHPHVNGDLQHHQPPTQQQNDDNDGDRTETNKKCCNCSLLKKISNGIVSGLELAFYRLGKFVARHPWKTILISVLVCVAAGVGLMKWHEENEYVKVWLPRGSRMYDEYHWVKEHFPESIRYEKVIVEDTNVLSVESINAMYDIYEKVTEFVVNDGLTINELCIKAGPICRVNSILELWSYDKTTIRSLTQEQVFQTVNQKVIYSPLYRNRLDLDKLLGDVERNNESKIVSARATSFFWFLKRNESTQDSAEAWEKMLIDLVNGEGHSNLDKMFIYTARTFDDVIQTAASNDVGLLTIGFAFVYLFFTFNIGKFSHIEQKIFLAAGGLLSIGMAIIFTYGVGLGTGIMFGPIHQITPFMLLGIGVDDMFVIMESLKQLSPKERQLSVEERIGLVMKHAGVSITVTSVTDIVAFAIGASTVIPSLSTFCIYASIGVLALYILQSTYFVAIVTIDESRIEQRRNACLPCITHDSTYKPWKFYNYSLQQIFMSKVWGPFLTKTPVKVIVILFAMVLSGVNVWSFIHIKHDFDPSMYLPKDSYSQRYVTADRRYFPDDGAFVQLYCGEMDYMSNFDTLMDLYSKVKTEPSVQSNTVDFWLASFIRWKNTTMPSTIPSNTSLNEYLNEVNGSSSSSVSPNVSLIQPYPSENLPVSSSESLFLQLMQFMMTEEGRVYWRYLKFDDIKKPTKIEGSLLTFRHVKCLSATCNIAAMDTMRDIVDHFSFIGGGTCFVYSSPQYMFNETNKVLKLELYRNLALAAVCVFVVTLVLIANFWTSVLVFICVVFTVIDVAGTMQFWDISVDTASSVILILCFGLAVDYSAHVGHSFMTHTGTKNERARKTLVSIGPAVFSGGFSTFLAFLLLVNSISYGFTLFFRIFTSVVIFGLFHGLVFLPVILSLIGPSPYNTNFISENDKIEDKYNEAAEMIINVKNGDVQMVELHPVNAKLNGKVNSDNFWKEYDSVEPMNGDICDTFNDNNTTIGLPLNEHNPRYSGSYYEQMSNGSLVQIPFPDSPSFYNNVKYSGEKI